jgi:predicted GNAT family acetyltransferase
MTEQTDAPVRDNPAKSRFELEIGGSLALAEYRLDGDVVTFTHTETPLALRGRGAATKLIHGALLAVRERGLKARASCSFVAAYLQRHKEFADLTG